MPKFLLYYLLLRRYFFIILALGVVFKESTESRFKRSLLQYKPFLVLHHYLQTFKGGKLGIGDKSSNIRYLSSQVLNYRIV